MKTTEEINKEILRRIAAFNEINPEVFAHAIVALGLLLVWIEEKNAND